MSGFRKIQLPSGYTLLVFDELTEYESDTDTRVSVYPPESDCGSKDDRVGELLLWSQDVPALLAMCGHKESDNTEEGREVTVEDDRIERAARLAWEAFAAGNGHADELWRHQRPERQARWREIARAVLVFFEPNDEVKRLESQLNGLRRAYDHACAQRDKYMRRTTEWREVADELRREVQQYHRSADEHVQKFERKHEQLREIERERDMYRDLAEQLYQDDACVFDHHGGCQAHGWLEPAPGEECPDGRAQRLFAKKDKTDDDVRACTGCGTCSICAALPRGLCGDRFDHAPHLHDSAGLGRFWCEADQSKRLPFAMERKGDGK